MKFAEWLKMNIDYEEKLLQNILKEYGSSNIKYKHKTEQLKLLKWELSKQPAELSPLS